MRAEIIAILQDGEMRQRLAAISATMQRNPGTKSAASAILGVLSRRSERGHAATGS